MNADSKSKEKELAENELLKKEIELLKNEIKYLKDNCIFKTKIETLYPKDLLTDGEKLNDYIRISKGKWQYGPYRHYEPGKYLIVYEGDGFLNGNFDVIDYGLKPPDISFSVIFKSQNFFRYEVIIPENLISGIEFRCNCQKDATRIIIKKIEVYKYNI